MSNFRINLQQTGWHCLTDERIAFIGARLIDPQINLDAVQDIIIESGRIAHIGKFPANWQGERIKAAGNIICPGFFDMHTHLREPGFEHKESVLSGCLAAAAGGFTGVACMPNTDPAIDTPGIVQFIRQQAEGQPVEVHPVAAVTKGRKGEVLSEMVELAECGVTAFSDDGSPVASAGLMRRAMEYAKMLKAVIIEHCEEPTLTANGVMHEGAFSTRLGLPGWPSVGEELAVQRNISLAGYTGGRLHIAHISTRAGAELVRRAKQEGMNITAEVTPQHLTLTCEMLTGYDSDFKVNPPLRETEDCEILLQALADGVIDCIATDHAPHTDDEKAVEFIRAPFGMLGLETALGVIYTKLVLSGKLSLTRFIDAMSVKPRQILNLPAATIAVGAPANLTIFDPNLKWTVDRNKMNSKSHNTPFHSWELTGRAVGVVNRGIVWMIK